MNMSTHALASLTATYTDSEPEGDDEDDDVPKEEEEKKSTSDPETEENAVSKTEASKATFVVPSLEVNSKVAKLVSYHDDTVISDEEGEGIFRGEHSSESKILVESIDGIKLPPEPTGRCSPHLVENVIQIHEKMAKENCSDMNIVIQSRKDFKNPSIYEKLIQYCGLNELGTNYPAGLYDPLKWGKESYFEELARVQKMEMDRREKEKKERTKVEFVSGTKKTNSVTSDEDLKKRKSKWDQVGAAAAGPGMAMGMIRPAGLLQPSLTTSVTGTKGTVISAFGSLPKKPRI